MDIGDERLFLHFWQKNAQEIRHWLAFIEKQAPVAFAVGEHQYFPQQRPGRLRLFQAGICQGHDELDLQRAAQASCFAGLGQPVLKQRYGLVCQVLAEFQCLLYPLLSLFQFVPFL